MSRSPELTVRQVMTADPVRLGPDDPVQEALDRMNRQRVGAVLVADANQLLGIFTERDFLKRAAGAAPGWRTTPLREWMSPNPYTIGPDAGWDEAVTSMQRLRVRHLPVVDGDGIVGIVSARQLLAYRSDFLNRIVEERTLALRRANEELLAHDAEVRQYMKVAARLQQRLILPASPPAWPGLTWGVHYAPLEPLGGDYYDFAQPDPDHLGILIADASGHGIPAAMVAIMARLAFREAADRTVRPAEVLAAMNHRLQDLADERFVTAFYGVFDRTSRRLRYANAGHPFPLRFSAATGRLESLSARGFLLGISPDEVYRENEAVLEPGDRLCLFTDGVTDCRNVIGESFGLERLSETLAEAVPPADGALTGPFLARLRAFQGTQKPADDMTLVIAAVDAEEII